MRPTLIIHFDAQHSREIPLDVHAPPMPADAARRWLDEQFVAEGCEPLRASGKLLTADKVLVLAQTVPGLRFTDDPAWASAYAAAALAALGRPLVTVDLAAGAISF